MSISNENKSLIDEFINYTSNSNKMADRLRLRISASTIEQRVNPLFDPDPEKVPEQPHGGLRQIIRAVSLARLRV